WRLRRRRLRDGFSAAPYADWRELTSPWRAAPWRGHPPARYLAAHRKHKGGAMSGIRLDGKVAIVTGATKGIGRAIVLALAGAGATILGTARHDDGTLELEQAVDQAGGVFRFLQADASRWDDCQQTVTYALESFG